MKTEEAIKYIQECIDAVKGAEGYEMTVQAHEMAIEALEKQIPKKPKYGVTGRTYCPCCDSTLPYAESDYKNGYVNKPYHSNNCMDCGQKLDWSENR